MPSKTFAKKATCLSVYVWYSVRCRQGQGHHFVPQRTARGGGGGEGPQTLIKHLVYDWEEAHAYYSGYYIQCIKLCTWPTDLHYVFQLRPQRGRKENK